MKRNDLEIAVHNVKVDFKRLSKKQFRKMLISWLQYFAIAMAITAILILITWNALTTPTSRDSFETTKWKNYQTEIKK